MKNAYPELPIIPYQKTSVSMADVVAALNTMTEPATIRIAAYVIFRNESGNGSKGLNNNYIGAQADSGRWSGDFIFAGVVEKAENKTGKVRLFLAFHNIAECLAFLVNRIEARGLYLGGTTSKVTKRFIATKEDWVKTYYQEWITGNAKLLPDETTKQNLLSIYNAGVTRIINHL